MSRSAAPTGAKQRLMSEMKALRKEKWINFEDDDSANLLKWRFALMVINSDSAFNGGYFRAEMVFSDDYPYQPPQFRFLIPIVHPNIYPDGHLCISILHKPGEDLMSGEQASERWSPLQGAESVLRSVLLLLDDPEISSPANVDAGVMYRDRRTEYEEKARATVQRSKKEIPVGFEMPKSFEPAPPPKAENDDDFWAASDEELDLGGSDTGSDDDDQDMGDFEDGDEEEEEQDGSDEEDEEEEDDD
ncbi:ubiquitin-conjugating enzyme/RWD-like protein [Podospora didyma]|uniref:Ubiquitin-conjugating enzyme/RWD-like protein n=1 Tax=Podospora didyma TaxID=330526 RepID=A0AAE0KLQ4_9PEZI|nr:ubiquitin-conjugating enzyme/RWD-like protein [Podospora didyma]